MIVKASGRYERPALIALYPSTYCMYSEMKKNIEKSDAPTSNPTTFAPVSVRSRKIPNGTSGSLERSSIATKAAKSTADTASNPIVWVEPQPALVASTNAYTRIESAAVTLTAPATSNDRTSSSDRLSAIRCGASSAAPMPIGTFTHSTHSQPTYSVSTP